MSGTEPPGSETPWEPNWDPEPEGEPEPAPEAPPEPSAVAPEEPIAAAAAAGFDTEPLAARPRSHRAPPPGAFVGRVLGPLVAIVVVAVVVVLLIWINGRPTSGTSVAAPSTSAVHPPTSAPPATTASTPPASPSTSTPPSTTPSTSPAISPSSKPSRSSHPPASRTAMAPVQVLNNSRLTGLAHQVAAEVANRGWHIGVIGNLQGAIPETTIYYSPGEKPAAEHLAREFAQVRRIEPNSAAGLTQSGITLVLTSDWVS